MKKIENIHVYNKNNIINKIIEMACSAILSTIFLLFYSSTTSPFTSSYGEDSAFYAMVGAAMKHGMLPYRDFYEMKGPYMYWIQYLGQVFSEGRFGTFLVQIINLTLTLFIVIQIINLVLNKISDKQSEKGNSNEYNNKKISGLNNKFVIIFIKAISLLYTLFIISFTFEGGNLTEEFSYPIMVLCLYFCIKYIFIINRNNIKGKEIEQENIEAEKKEKIQNEDHPLLIGLFYGAAFGFFAYVRIINAAFLGAVLLTIVIYLISKKNWKNILLNGLAFIGGMILCMLPATIWAAINGILKDMINEIFILAFSYSTELETSERFLLMKNFVWPMILIACIPIFSLLIFLKKDWKLWFLSISSAIILLVAVSMGDGYLHYFSLQLPNVVLGIVVILLCLFDVDEKQKEQSTEKVENDNSNNDKKEIAEKKNTIRTIQKLLLFFVVVVTLFMQKNVIKDRTVFMPKCTIESIKNGNPDEFDVAYINDIMMHIPEYEKNSVYLYGFGSCSQWYAKAGIFPPNPYCDWQPHWIILYPNIKDEIITALSSKELKWVVIPNGATVWPDEVNMTIHTNYCDYYGNDFYMLMRCIE